MREGYNRKNRRKYELTVHIILVTKYRRKLFTRNLVQALKEEIINLAERNNWSLIALETDQDHLHVLLGYDTTERVCDMVHSIKQNTTYRLWQHFEDTLLQYYWKEHLLWSDGYFACSVGEVSIETVKRYMSRRDSVRAPPSPKGNGFPPELFYMKATIFRVRRPKAIITASARCR